MILFLLCFHLSLSTGRQSSAVRGSHNRRRSLPTAARVSESSVHLDSCPRSRHTPHTHTLSRTLCRTLHTLPASLHGSRPPHFPIPRITCTLLYIPCSQTTHTHNWHTAGTPLQARPRRQGTVPSLFALPAPLPSRRGSLSAPPFTNYAFARARLVPDFFLCHTVPFTHYFPALS